MKPFHVVVHARPKVQLESQSISLDGTDLRTLLVRSSHQSTAMQVTFEEAAAALEALPGMHVEFDGSFVWRSRQDPLWQIDGNLYDRDGRLVRVDLKGTCPETELQQLLAAFGRDATPLLFELVHHAVFLDETEFGRSLYQ